MTDETVTIDKHELELLRAELASAQVACEHYRRGNVELEAERNALLATIRALKDAINAALVPYQGDARRIHQSQGRYDHHS